MPVTTATGARRISVAAFLRRRQRGKWTALAAVALLLVLALLCRSGLFASRADYRQYDGKPISPPRVIDALTLAAADARFRLAGLDAPPSAWASAAADRVRQLLAVGPVTLQLDPGASRDAAGRLLVYVVLPDGRMLNEVLLQEGLARADHLSLHLHDARFLQLEDQARLHKAGLWSKKNP